MKNSISDKNLIKLALSYKNNLGMEEMVKFYQTASEDQIKEFEIYLSQEDYLSAWNLLKQVTQVDLEDY